MKIIGIAGPSGTGKSTIARHLEGRGGVAVDADRVGHRLLEQDTGVIEAVRREVGEDVFDEGGCIDRKRLGARVFADAETLRRYNAIIHPAIRRRCGERVAQARSDGTAFVVIDAALLLDSQMPFGFDLMIALTAPEDQRFERLVARGERSPGEVRARLASQPEIEKSFYKADVVVDTGRDLDEVLADIDRLVDRLMNDRT